MAAIDEVLDNPVWFSLVGPHASLALGDGEARRYPGDISAFAAVESPTRDALKRLADLCAPGESVIVYGALELPREWELVSHFLVTQMVCEHPVTVELPAEVPAVVPLSLEDLSAILELVAITRPGPFMARTIVLGPYLSMWHEDRLIAMGGVRAHPPGCREISGVCTHPEYRRRGYSKVLVSMLIQEMQRAGDVPFLTVAQDNLTARALYESFGFVVRKDLAVPLLRRV